MIETHQGRGLANSILDIITKMDILDEDFRDLRSAVELFWDGAFVSGSSHSSYCNLQREVWRASFHVSASAQSVSETVKSTMRKYSSRRKSLGRKIHEYQIRRFATKWDEFKESPIYKFNECLRGSFYHVRLTHADWVGYRDFVTQKSKERFLLPQEPLFRLADREPKALQYIRSRSINVRGHRHRKGDEVYGLDLVAHYQRYRAVLRKICHWTISQLEDPEFGKHEGFPSHALEEYLDFERASMGVSKRWRRCRHCGTWFGR